MKTHSRLLIILLIGLALAIPSLTVHAQVYWRVSVKVFLAPNGDPPRPTGEPNYDTFQEIRNGFALYNQIFDRMGWGFRLDLVDLVGIPGVINSVDWFNKAARDGANRLQLELAAKAQPGVFHYRPADAINIYVNRTSSGISGGHLPLLGDVMFIGIDENPVSTPPPDLANRFWALTMLHETGHALGLCHTHGCDCNACDEPPPGFPSDYCQQPRDDGLGDTILDVACWSRDQIAQGNFQLNYAALNPGQAQQVNTVFSNIMSYHAQTLSVITHDQWEHMVDISNDLLTGKRNVASGSTVFVDRNNSCLRPEDLAWPFSILAGFVPGWSWGTRHGLGVTLDPRNPPPGAPALGCPPAPVPCSVTVCLGGPFKKVGDAVNGAHAGDRLQIKAGHYNEAMHINKQMILVTDRGDVVIGKP